MREIILGGALALTAVSADAQTLADEAAVRVLAGRIEAAWSANDAAAYAGLFTPDGETVLPRGLRLEGRDAIQEGHVGVFATIYRGTTLDFMMERVRFLTPDIALAAVRQMIHPPAGADPQGSAGQDLMTTMIVRRDGGGWVIEYMDTIPAAPSDFALPTAE